MSSGWASFAVNAGTSARFTGIDFTGMTPDEMAEAIEDNDAVQEAVQVNVCHQCAEDVDDPQVDEMTGFTVDGVDYERGRDGHWRAYVPGQAVEISTADQVRTRQDEAIQRVTAFLTRHAERNVVEKEIIFRVDDHELRASDLTLLCNAVLDAR